MAGKQQVYSTSKTITAPFCFIASRGDFRQTQGHVRLIKTRYTCHTEGSLPPGSHRADLPEVSFPKSARTCANRKHEPPATFGNVTPKLDPRAASPCYQVTARLRSSVRCMKHDSGLEVRTADQRLPVRSVGRCCQ